jgi:hypothetical protein
VWNAKGIFFGGAREVPGDAGRGGTGPDGAADGVTDRLDAAGCVGGAVRGSTAGVDGGGGRQEGCRLQARPIPGPSFAGRERGSWEGNRSGKTRKKKGIGSPADVLPPLVT